MISNLYKLINVWKSRFIVNEICDETQNIPVDNNLTVLNFPMNEFKEIEII